MVSSGVICCSMLSCVICNTNEMCININDCRMTKKFILFIYHLITKVTLNIVSIGNTVSSKTYQLLCDQLWCGQLLCDQLWCDLKQGGECTSHVSWSIQCTCRNIHVDVNVFIAYCILSTRPKNNVMPVTWPIPTDVM